MVINCTYWPKSNANLNLVAFLWQSVSNRDIDSMHLLHASGNMLNSCLYISYLGLLHLKPYILFQITFSEC